MLKDKDNWTDPKAWLETAAEQTPADWYLLTADDLESMEAEEYDRIKAQAETWRRKLRRSNAYSTTNADRIIEVIAAHRSANPEDVAAKCGLVESSPENFFAGKLKAKDFAYGSKLYPQRPQYGATYTERSAIFDQAVLQKMMLVQTVNAGLDEFIRVSRSLCLLNRLSDLASAKPRSHRCDGCGHDNDDDASWSSIFITCGHVLCPACASSFQHRGRQESGACPVGDCSSLNDGALIPCRRLVETDPGRLVEFEGTSAKVAKITDVVAREIAPANEKALIFTTNGLVKKELAGALATVAGLAVYQTTGGDDDAAAIAKFKGAKGAAVLLQTLMSSESAGTNLTEANHVLFAAPLHTDTRNYYMYLRQARGRAVRQGQSRAVRVYHFVVAHTMEVEVLEQRLRYQIPAPKEGDEGRVQIDGRGQGGLAAKQLLFGNSVARKGGEAKGEEVTPLDPESPYLPPAGIDDAAPPTLGTEDPEDPGEAEAEADKAEAEEEDDGEKGPRATINGSGTAEDAATLRRWLAAVGAAQRKGGPVPPTAKTPAVAAATRGALCSYISQPQVDKALGCQEEWE